MGERTFFLHIGMPKTASTFLQERVFPRLGHLAVRSVPRTNILAGRNDPRRERRTFACALTRSSALWHELGDALFEEMLGPQRDWLESRLDLLVSDEAIGRAGSRPELLAAHIRSMAAVARRWGFSRIVPIALVRRQDSWLASHFAQVSDRYPQADQAWFEARVRAILDPAQARFGFGMMLDYAAILDAFSEADLVEAPCLLPFESLAEDRKAALARLLAFVGTPEGQARTIAEEASGRENVRSEKKEGRASWRLRPPSIALPGRPGRLAMPRRLWPTRRIALTSSMTEDIMRVYGPANQRLSAFGKTDLSHYGYHEKSLLTEEWRPLQDTGS